MSVRRFSLVVGLVLAVGAPSVALVSGCAAHQTSRVSSDEALSDRVTAALAAATDVDAGAIRVETGGGVVTLTGRVSSGFEQQSVGAIVRAIPGVSEVRFALVVEPDPGNGP